LVLFSHQGRRFSENISKGNLASRRILTTLVLWLIERIKAGRWRRGLKRISRSRSRSRRRYIKWIIRGGRRRNFV
jgi:hypothetical protein